MNCKGDWSEWKQFAKGGGAFKSPAWTRKDCIDNNRGNDMIASCNDLIPTYSVIQTTCLLLFALNAKKISLLNNITNIAFVLMEQYATDLIAKVADKKGQEHIGQDLFIQPFLSIKNKHAKLVKKKNLLNFFTQMGVFLTELKSIEVLAKNAYFLKQKLQILFNTKQKQNADHLARKILFPEFLITLQNVKNTLVLILTLFTFLNFTKNNKGFAHCLVLK